MPDMPALKIAFVISSLSSGGAERVASLLCSAWVERGHHVDIITFEPTTAQPYYPLDARITVHRLDLMKETRGAISFVRHSLHKIRKIKQAIKTSTPDIVISFMADTNILAILAARWQGIPIIVSERIHPHYHPIGRVKNYLRKRSYPMAKTLVVQTQAIADWAADHLPGTTVDIIANPIDLAKFAPLIKAPIPRKRLLAVGRLNPQKGYDLLIPIFAQLATQHPDWDLYIYGEGAARPHLQHLINTHNMAQRIFLPGVTQQVFQDMKNCDIFVHPARYEGFPNTVLEALAAGCPVVATDHSGGAADVLQGNTFGIFTDAANLPMALDKMMSDPALRQHYGAKAADAVAPYDVPIIATQWLDLCTRVIRTP
jgi:glycosyltransferase involved in cell wall biosynthesis